MISTALAESTIEEETVPSGSILLPPSTALVLDKQKAQVVSRRLGEATGRHLKVFDTDGNLIADSHKLMAANGTIEIARLNPPQKKTLFTVEVLKVMAKYIIGLIPKRRTLPPYPEPMGEAAEFYPDTQDALNGQLSVSAWMSKNNRIFLSTAAPITRNGDIKAIVLMTRTAEDIEEAVIGVWFDIMRVFGITLMITIFLSIYLAGLIARPLRKLMLAAENVRAGKSRDIEIPDLSYRHDEIGELSIVLREMTEALWDRMDGIEKFAADVAHELKNPLTSLKSAIETLGIVKKQSDREKLLDIIEHDIRRMDRLITEISHASRLDSELSREAFEEVDLTRVLNRLIDIYRDPMERHNKPVSKSQLVTAPNNITIKLDIPEHESLHLLGLELRLGQVFQNLVANALSFSEAGSTVSIHAAIRLNSIVITVEDHGPGIPESKLNSIFERFYSERPEHEDYGSHSGLGLSICKQIIEAHRGRIFAENRKDAKGNILGARFTVILNKL